MEMVNNLMKLNQIKIFNGNDMLKYHEKSQQKLHQIES